LQSTQTLMGELNMNAITAVQAYINNQQTVHFEMGRYVGTM